MIRSGAGVSQTTSPLVLETLQGPEPASWSQKEPRILEYSHATPTLQPIWQLETCPPLTVHWEGESKVKV